MMKRPATKPAKNPEVEWKAVAGADLPPPPAAQSKFDAASDRVIAAVNELNKAIVAFRETQEGRLELIIDYSDTPQGPAQIYYHIFRRVRSVLKYVVSFKDGGVQREEVDLRTATERVDRLQA